MRRAALTASLIAPLLAGPALAAGWLAPNGFLVEGGPQAIVVQPIGAAGSAALFCAAASYAAERLGASGSDSVVISSPRSGRVGGPGGETVGFRLDPNAEPDHGLFLKASRQGEAVSVAHARTLCRDIPDE
ncbi:MAG: hypothetical protein JXQ91_12950 [Vannielia sp.]|uniref:hypothetical protein n=1 Tax=Rhodobacterales TaxID=204455 RepID=UPI0020948E57|nr:hypothetical protein [Oceanicola sp. 502str15]MCO6382804.1 hypothetical protein [Oceanicola sp. 502str15]